jgi:hypothetical protein
MRLCARNVRSVRPRRRTWAALAALAAAAAFSASVVTAVPASAQTAETYIYLAHETSFGMYGTTGATDGSVIALTTVPWGTWEAISYGTTSEDGITGPGYEFEAVTTSGNLSGWCLQTLLANDYARLGPCAAGGTVFVAVYSDGGYILYSRYFLNLGAQVALATYGYGTDYAVVAVPASGLVTGVYYRWAFTDLPS